VASYAVSGQNDRDDILVGREDGTVSIFSFTSQHDEDPPEEVFSTVRRVEPVTRKKIPELSFDCVSCAHFDCG
jgi:hypothetical protein